MEASKLDHERHVRACPQLKEASKQTDVTSKKHAKDLVLKLWMRANTTSKGLVRACPQNRDTRKQRDVTSKRNAKALVLNLRKRAN